MHLLYLVFYDPDKDPPGKYSTNIGKSSSNADLYVLYMQVWTEILNDSTDSEDCVSRSDNL